jgi:hypothetical protein
MSRIQNQLLKNKIAPQVNEVKVLKDKFDVADKELSIIDNQVLPLRNNVERKTFSIPSEELLVLRKLKDKALDYKIVITDSEIIRVGLKEISNIEGDNFCEKIADLKKLKCGRPKSA